MANIYLEKIASVMDTAFGVGKSLASGVASAGKYAGKEVSTALGGGERAYLAKLYGVGNPKKIAAMGDKFSTASTRKKVLKERVKAFNNPAGDHETYRKNLRSAVDELRGLQKNKTDARIIVGIGAGGAHVAHKKYKEAHPGQENYPATYYDYQ